MLLNRNHIPFNIEIMTTRPSVVVHPSGVLDRGRRVFRDVQAACQYNDSVKVTTRSGEVSWLPGRIVHHWQGIGHAAISKMDAETRAGFDYTLRRFGKAGASLDMPAMRALTPSSIRNLFVDLDAPLAAPCQGCGELLYLEGCANPECPNWSESGGYTEL